MPKKVMSNTAPKDLMVVACPRCGARLAWNTQNPYRPFCSERCKLIDLGQWASENYRITQTGRDNGEPAGQEEN
jgi:endogenous inhibitor of DNA gyrase (YacG/DUF329 family)